MSTSKRRSRSGRSSTSKTHIKLNSTSEPESYSGTVNTAVKKQYDFTKTPMSPHTNKVWTRAAKRAAEKDVSAEEAASASEEDASRSGVIKAKAKIPTICPISSTNSGSVSVTKDEEMHILPWNEELLKDRLTPCREICPILFDVFIWRKEVYPLYLVGIITAIFGTIWYYDPSFLTAISVLGLIVTIGDYFLPVVSRSVGSPEAWTTEKEKKFSIFVNRIAYYAVKVWNFELTISEWKRDYPNAYSSSVIVTLLFLAWIGNAVSNLILAYFLVLFMALLPGLLQRRIPQVYCSKAVLAITGWLGIKPKNN